MPQLEMKILLDAVDVERHDKIQHLSEQKKKSTNAGEFKISNTDSHPC